MNKIVNSRIKNGKEIRVHFNAIEKCSKCNKALAPEDLYSIVVEKEDGMYFYVIDFCSSCKSAIVTEYIVQEQIDKRGVNYLQEIKINYSAPVSFEEAVFDDELEKLSPQFVKIYNQSLQAEKIGLDEIAGLGYRKSVEFLIKDYAISKYPEKEDEIKKLWMKVCIEQYIDDNKIKTLAERADWIGNDEAHYIRKQEDKDINDMKKFIKAMTYYIGINIITDEAYKMENKNTK